MDKDDETTSVQLLKLLRDNGIQLSLVTILRCRSSLGWTFRGSAYCQLIRDVNKVKRLDWCKANSEDNFENVIFTDECSIQMETHRRFACRRKGEAPRPKPRPKHPLKDVWAGISLRGRTAICIFEGRMNAPLFVQILEQTLIPFIEQVYPDSHRLMQDNDPKHTSKFAKNFYERSGVNHWQTPPESPDLNPIENMWHEYDSTRQRTVRYKGH